MVVYLVNPNEQHLLENAGDRLPIGLLSIGAYLKSRGEQVKVYDLNHDEEGDLVRDVIQDDNATVGISVYTSPSFPESVRLAQELRSEARLIAGGIHASHMPGTLAPYFDVIIRGEGEESMWAAIHRPEIRGTINYAPPDLSKLPNPDFEMVDVKRYGMNMDGKKTATLITSRGCPYSCAFCGKLEKKVRLEPTHKVNEQIDYFWWNTFKALYFLDDVFTLNEGRMEEIVKHAYHKQMPFRFTTRANLVNPKKLDILADNGAEWMSIGIESGNNTILANSNKGLTTQQNYDAVKLAHERGIKTKGFFIIGLPGETEETAKQTIDFSLQLRDEGLTDADFYFLTPFPGTAIWQQPTEFDIKINDRDYTTYLEAGKGARCVIDSGSLRSWRIEELVQEAKAKWKN